MSDNPPCIPVVSAIIQRKNNGKVEVLVQTRWKPDRDPIYSGTLEIPAGWIEKYENVYDALRREVYEETGLKVVRIYPDVKTQTFSSHDDESFAFVPFCCQQQLKGGKPWIGFVFLCEVENKEPVAQSDEVKDIQWMNKTKLQELVEKNPEKIFTLQLGALSYYFSHTNEINL